MKKFSFDYDQLIENVKEEKARLGWSWRQLAVRTGIPIPTVAYYMTGTNRPAGTKVRFMNASHVIRLMMLMKDYDIRDYLIEESSEGGE